MRRTVITSESKTLKRKGGHGNGEERVCGERVSIRQGRQVQRPKEEKKKKKRRSGYTMQIILRKDKSDTPCLFRSPLRKPREIANVARALWLWIKTAVCELGTLQYPIEIE